MEPVDNNYDGRQVRLCKDGKYRWSYDLNMFKNPTIVWTVYKIFFWIIVIGGGIFAFFLYVIHGDWAGLWSMTKALLIGLGGFAVLTLLGYLVVAIVYHGKYEVMFVMSEKEIRHIQRPQQFAKAQKLGAVTAVAGVGARRPATAGAGMAAATKQASVSEFDKVRKVKAHPRLNLIKVNQLFEKNQIYVPDEDFAFIYDYIKTRCNKAK